MQRGGGQNAVAGKFVDAVYPDGPTKPPPTRSRIGPEHYPSDPFLDPIPNRRAVVGHTHVAQDLYRSASQEPAEFPIPTRPTEAETAFVSARSPLPKAERGKAVVIGSTAESPLATRARRQQLALCWPVIPAACRLRGGLDRLVAGRHPSREMARTRYALRPGTIHASCPCIATLPFIIPFFQPLLPSAATTVLTDAQQGACQEDLGPACTRIGEVTLCRLMTFLQ